MTVHKAIATALVSLVVLMGAVVLYARSIDFDQYRGQLSQELSDATGRDVTIDGPVELAFGFDSAFVIKGVRIGNAPWGSRPELAKIRVVEARFRLLPLLAGRVRIDRLRLIQPDVWLETDPVGKVNWVMAATPTGQLPGAESGSPATDKLLGMLGVAGVDVVGGRLTYRDGQTGGIQVLAFKQAFLEGDGIVKPLLLGMEGSWNGLPLSSRGAVGPLAGGTGNVQSTYPVDLSLTIGGVQIDTKGTLGNIDDGPGITLEFSARADTLRGLETALGAAISGIERVSLTASVSYRNDTLTLSKLRFGVGDSSASGTVSIDFTPAVPEFLADLTSPQINLADLLGQRTSARGIRVKLPPLVEPTEDERIPSRSLWRPEILKEANGFARLRAGSLQVGRLRAESVDLSVRLQDRLVVVSPLRARFAGGAIEGQARIDARQKPSDMVLTLKAPSFAIGPLLQQLNGVGTFDGTVVASVELQAKGDNPKDLLATLNGEALLAMGSGRLTTDPRSAEPFNLSTAGVPALIGMLIAKDQRDVVLNCAANRLVIRDGVVNSVGAVIESEHASVSADGHVDLRTEQYALRVTPTAKGSPLAVPAPVAVRGPLDQPVLAAEGEARTGRGGLAAALSPLRSFFDRFRRDNSANACLKAVARKVERPRKVRSRKTERPRRPESARKPAPRAPERAPEKAPREESADNEELNQAE